MHIAVTDKATEVVGSTESLTARTVRNTGSQIVTLGRGSDVTAAKGFDVAATKEQLVWLAPGESLWAICGSSQTSTLEVI